jgi:hypothetical protein
MAQWVREFSTVSDNIKFLHFPTQVKSHLSPQSSSSFTELTADFYASMNVPIRSIFAAEPFKLATTHAQVRRVYSAFELSEPTLPP